MTKALRRPAALAALAGTALLLSGCGVNTIPAKEEAVKAKWAAKEGEPNGKRFVFHKLHYSGERLCPWPKAFSIMTMSSQRLNFQPQPDTMPTC